MKRLRSEAVQDEVKDTRIRQNMISIGEAWVNASRTVVKNIVDEIYGEGRETDEGDKDVIGGLGSGIRGGCRCC